MHKGGVPIQRCTGRYVSIYSLARNLILRFTENDAFKGSNIRVIGISPDSVEQQDVFVKNQKLTVIYSMSSFQSLAHQVHFTVSSSQ